MCIVQKDRWTRSVLLRRQNCHAKAKLPSSGDSSLQLKGWLCLAWPNGNRSIFWTNAAWQAMRTVRKVHSTPEKQRLLRDYSRKARKMQTPKQKMRLTVSIVTGLRWPPIWWDPCTIRNINGSSLLHKQVWRLDTLALSLGLRKPLFLHCGKTEGGSP